MSQKIKEKLFTIDNLPSKYEKRVFIGGNYKNIALLREVYKFVEQNKFQPILVADFTIPEEKENEIALFLLQSCKFAIFEMSTLGSGGELMELERTKDYKNITLVLYQIIYADLEPDVPRMIKSLKKIKNNLEIWAYPNLDELKNTISKWLEKDGSASNF